MDLVLEAVPARDIHLQPHTYQGAGLMLESPVGSVGLRAEVAQAPSDHMANSSMTVGGAWRLLCPHQTVALGHMSSIIPVSIRLETGNGQGERHAPGLSKEWR